MEMKKEMTLDEYLKDKRNYNVDLSKMFVQWKNEAHKLVKKNNEVYVQIKEILKASDILEMFEEINTPENKSILKNMLFEINGNKYIIEGYGGEAIKACKNGTEPEFFRYFGTKAKNIEAQELLKEMYNYIHSDLD